MNSIDYHNSHGWRYIFFIAGFIWLLFTGYLYYTYLISSTDQAPTKGGTLIEGVSSSIAYVPNIKMGKDRFYKSLLFRSCVSVTLSEGQNVYTPDLCDVITEDNKTFFVKMLSGASWSDGTPVSINDLLFSYDTIIKENVWDLPYFKNYNSIEIQKTSPTSFSVSFPQASQENMFLFSYFVLPHHILKDKTRERFTNNFTQTPITNGCAMLSNSRDDESLIFDISKCSGAYITKYQVKNYPLKEMQEDPQIVDMYIGEEAIPSYKTGTVISNEYSSMFFNMQRGKLGIYGRKNLIALINKYLYLPENNVPLAKEHYLFDTFPTAVTDKSTISSVSSGYTITGLPTLENEASGSGTLYALSKLDKRVTIKIHSTQPFTKIISNNTQIIQLESPNSENKRITLVNGITIFPGYNEYSLLNKEGNIVDTFSIYYDTKTIVARSKLIHIIYSAQDKLYTHIIDVMKNIMLAEGLNDYFFFDGLPTQQAYNSILESKEYDVALQGIDIGFKKDISSLFLISAPSLNPSLYENSNLAMQIRHYFNASLQAQYDIMPLISKLYNTDLPLFILGKPTKVLSIKPDLPISLSYPINELNVRDTIAKELVLVHKPQVTKQDILNRRMFFTYIRIHLGLGE